MEGYLHSTTSLTYLARSSVALIEVILGVSSLLLVCVCPLPPLHEANSSLIPPHLAIAVGEQATVPSAGSKEEGLLMGVVVVVAVAAAVKSTPLGEVIRDGVSTSVVVQAVQQVEVEETCWWRILESEKSQRWPPPERNER